MVELTADELREKYSRPQALPVAPRASETSTLDSVKICPTCQAQGLIKQQYGYRVMDLVCPTCDGEGCIVSGRQKRAAATERQRLEAAINSCTDLDVLDKLEAAMRSNDPALVEGVLAKLDGGSCL